jgi:hypothetical protein
MSSQVLAVVLQQLVDQTPLPILLMRTVLLCLRLRYIYIYIYISIRFTCIVWDHGTCSRARSCCVCTCGLVKTFAHICVRVY